MRLIRPSWLLLRFLPESFFQWRLRRLTDPVEKLRFMRRFMGAGHPPRKKSWESGRLIWVLAGMLVPLAALPLRSLMPVLSSNGTLQPPVPPPAAGTGLHPAAPGAGSEVLHKVWLVKETREFEMYSNGLRVERPASPVRTVARRYFSYPRTNITSSAAQVRRDPAGIVFHTSESDLAPFNPSNNGLLQRQGESLVAYARNNALYHYVVDRFGRMHRIVEESDKANHSGNSIWADDRWAYVNLNTSFFGVSFETETRPGDVRPMLSPAQARAGRVLVEMLRSRYALAAQNCVTHGQVSVNPDRALIGYHTDWGGNFPFGDLGLPDNYAQPLPALSLFGFGYDNVYVQSTGGRMLFALALSDELVRGSALAAGTTASAHRAALLKNYRQIISTLPKPSVNPHAPTNLQEKTSHE
jgi:hypothetical protein